MLYCHIHIHMQDTYWRNEKWQAKNSLEKYIPLNLFARFERVVWGFTVRGSWRPNSTAIYWPPTLMAVSVVSFSLSRAAQPKAQGLSSLLDDGFLYCILSATSLDPNSSDFQLNWGPQGPLRPGVSFPTTSCLLLQLIRGSKGPLRRAFSTTSYQQLLWTPTHQGAPRAPSDWCGFPYHISSITPTGSVLTELYNNSIAHSIFGMTCLIVIKWK